MKKILFIVLVFFAVSNLFAQQDAMFTHYMFNTLQVNPAYAGSRDALTVTSLHRTQWLGFDGAPISQTVTMHSPIVKNIGVGFSLINDQNGPVGYNSVYLDLSYGVKINNISKLSLGLKGGFNMVKVALSDIKVNDLDDEVFSSDFVSDPLPNAGIGLYYSTSNFYTGISSPRIVQHEYGPSNQGGEEFDSDQRHFFYIMGFVAKISDNYSLRPTSYIKATSGAPIEADITLTMFFKDVLWAGMMYRTGDAAGVLTGFNLTEQVQIGYSFDWSFGVATGQYNIGSHEIVLRYDFIYQELDKIKSPRYF